MNFLPQQIEDYLKRHTTPETETLRQVVRVTERSLEHTDMISGRQVGQLLKLLLRTADCRRVLEIGTFTGYSAIWMADALPGDGELITLEMNERYRQISAPFFSQQPYNRIIRQVMGPALETLDKLEGDFDLVFIDADKLQYPDYFVKVRPKLKKGGVLIADNVLWGGTVLAPDDPKSRAIDRMNRMIHEDPDFENTILPVRDGLMVAVKVRA